MLDTPEAKALVLARTNTVGIDQIVICTTSFPGLLPVAETGSRAQGSERSKPMAFAVQFHCADSVGLAVIRWSQNGLYWTC